MKRRGLVTIAGKNTMAVWDADKNAPARPLTLGEIQNLPEGEDRHNEALAFYARLIKYNGHIVANVVAVQFGLTKEEQEEAKMVASVKRDFHPDKPVGYPIKQRTMASGGR
ncbi:MAG: hypothetical protein WCS37_10385 [Chloroflexota bacterium]